MSMNLRRQISSIRAQTQTDLIHMQSRLSSIEKKLEENKPILYFDSELNALRSDFGVIVSSLSVIRDFEKQIEEDEKDTNKGLSEN